MLRTGKEVDPPKGKKALGMREGAYSRRDTGYLESVLVADHGYSSLTMLCGVLHLVMDRSISLLCP